MVAPDSPRSERGARLCVVAVVVSVLGFGALQLMMPAGFESLRGLNPRAVQEWRGWLGCDIRADAAAISAGLYRTLFRTALAIACAAYGALAVLVMRGARLGRGWTWRLAIPLVVTLAVVIPPSLSTDVFAYLGYARLGVVHGLNPHLHTQADLVRLGDLTSAYLRWPIPSPYGPLWTLLSMAVVRAARALGHPDALLGPVIVFKLVAGGGLLAAAAVARALARRQDPARGEAVFVLVAVNPLLLIEGPANGHNDLVMVALLMVGLLALAARQGRRAAVAVGIAAAIKLVPLIIIPWLAAVAARMARENGRSRIAAVSVTVALALVPLLAAYAPLWQGPRTLSGVMMRWQKGDPATSARRDTAAPPAHAPEPASLVPQGPTASPVSPSPASSRGLSLPTRADQQRTRWSAVLTGVLRVAPALLLYLWGTLAMALGRGGDSALRLATVWSFVALGILCFAAGLWCSWYLAWLWPPLLLRWSRPHRLLGAFVLPFSLLLLLAYATPPG